MRALSLLLILTCSFFSLSAQNDCQKFEDCLEYAYQHSPSIRRSELSFEQSQLNQRQAAGAQHPSVNGSVRYGLNAGRSVDLTSYQFVNQTMQAVNLSVNANLPLYNGFQLRNTLQQRRTEVAASQQDLIQAKNDLGLSLAQSYLSLLLAQANVEIAQEQLRLSKEQLQRTEKLIAAGNLAENSRYDLLAQIARDEQNLVNSQNSQTLAELNLKQIINWPQGQALTLCPVDIQLPDEAQFPQFEALYQQASQKWPSLRAAQLREQASQTSIRVAEGALQPSVSLYASLTSNYSSTGQRYSGDTVTVNQVLQGDLNGNPFVLTIPSSVPLREKSPFFTQISDNFTQGFGINVQVPIYNGNQARINIRRAELNWELSKINTEQLQLQLQNEVQQALNAAQASARSFQAANRSFQALQVAALNSQKRFEQGLINAFEWSSVQTNLMNARANLENARYDYYFRLKIIEYYQSAGF